MSPSHLTLEHHADALRQAGGDRNIAAKILGCSRSTIDRAAQRLAKITAMCAPYLELPSNRRRYRPEQVAEALRQAGGSQTQAARQLGCRKETVAAYIQHYPEVKAALHGCPSRLKSPEEIAEALRQAGGDKRRAAELLGVSLSTLYQYAHRYPAVREECAALDQARRAKQIPYTPRGHPERFSPDKVAEALRRAGGIKSHAAAALDCTRATVDSYIKRYPEVREAWIDARETLVDIAQAKLQEKVERGEWRAVHYTLATLGKGRGFTTRPTPTDQEPDATGCERCRAKFEADLKRVYGELTEG